MITKEKFKAYLEVQKGGQTNMFNVNMVCMLVGYILDSEDVMEIIKNYGKYCKKFKLTTADVKASKKKVILKVVDEED